ncbi:cellulose synthase (UDP-forming) [Paraoerskovia marina]|uniref:Cellulose synthase (UDP-forming) n=1 Tax=Paraoerskovia marina TaxID=545619 RepID=A0A1H1U7S2_9CELL|nr:cellulose synthase catalytic subunit [Paraoerskovia marina]SDS68391.1 cellulose synthase (UDP-forming) [Paraoerskovia marina]
MTRDDTRAGGRRALPSPPSDVEAFRDLGPVRPWVQPVAAAASLPVLVSLALFAGRAPWLWPLYLTLALTAVSLLLWVVTGIRRPRVSAESHLRLVRRWAPEKVPSVDVFVPVCGEDLEVLENTFAHVEQLYWTGGLTVWVLDDGADPHVARLAERYGFRYRVRPDRGRLKKAGNLRSAFAASGAEVIAIFDADFCPRPDFLRQLVPYLDDPEVGIVQSPQDFDTDPSMGWLQRTAGATQEIFYRWVQPSRDRIGATVCCGTNALYRRSALELIGGFPEIDHSEDLYTGIWLMRAGFETRFVPLRLAKGLCPDELGPFLTQQYRWANGTVAMVTDRENDLRGLRRIQRTALWAGLCYYTETSALALNIFVPSVVMCWIYPQDVLPAHLLLLLPSLWVMTVLFPVVHRSHWRIEVLRVQLAQSFAHLLVLAHAIRGNYAGWVPTGSGGGSSALARSIARVMVTTLTVGVVAWLGGVVVGVATYGLAQFWGMAALAAGYTWLAVPLIVDGLRIVRPRGFSPRASAQVRSGTTVPRYARAGLAP